MRKRIVGLLTKLLSRWGYEVRRKGSPPWGEVQTLSCDHAIDPFMLQSRTRTDPGYLKYVKEKQVHQIAKALANAGVIEFEELDYLMDMTRVHRATLCFTPHPRRYAWQ